jgi:hypothetical protein
LNSLTAGCNQKSNRDPHMNLTMEEVEDALVVLRELGVVAEVHGDGRVPRYRHYMKEWIQVAGIELAVMAELLLRGAQTVGELRGRAARMAVGQLPDLEALRPVLQELINKGLVIELTPPGRGQVVTHALYEPHELAQLKSRYVAGRIAGPGEHYSSLPGLSASSGAASQDAAVAVPSQAHEAPQAAPYQPDDQLRALRDELAELKKELGRLQQEVEDIWSNLR